MSAADPRAWAERLDRDECVEPFRKPELARLLRRAARIEEAAKPIMGFVQHGGDCIVSPCSCNVDQAWDALRAALEEET